MYPSAHVSRPHLIDYHADDTEMLLHLDKMMHGAPHPQNVLTDVDVDPYAVAPWNLPRKHILHLMMNWLFFHLLIIALLERFTYHYL